MAVVVEQGIPLSANQFLTHFDTRETVVASVVMTAQAQGAVCAKELRSQAMQQHFSSATLVSASGDACKRPGRRPRAPWPLALAGCLYLTSVQVSAVPVVYKDNYTLQTTNQSMWGSGAQAAWKYDSGFQGAAWGTYAGVAAKRFDINAIAGSQNTLLFPGTPDACLWGYCIDGLDPVYVDTRTGFSVNGSSSGRVGVDVYAEANGGGLDVMAPILSTLTIGDAFNGMFPVYGSNELVAGATITAKAPSFKAGVDGVINIDASVNATGCAIAAGCGTTDSLDMGLNPGQFSLVAFDTSKDKPVSLLGFDVPVIRFGKEYVYRAGELPCQGPAEQDGTAPQCDKSPFKTPALGVVKADNLADFSGGSLATGTLTLTQNQPVLRLTADITGIAQQALGFAVDVLNPTVSVGIATVGGSVINLQAGFQIGLTQEFAFTPKLLTTLLFDKPISEYKRVIDYYPCAVPLVFGTCLLPDFFNPVYKFVLVEDRGTSVTVDLASGTFLKFTGEEGNLMGRTYAMAPDSFMESDSRLSIDPTMPIRAGCFTVSWKFPLSSALDNINECLFREEFRTTDLVSIPVFENAFGLGGFNTASFFGPSDNGPDPIYNEPGGRVPEPSGLSLAVLALGALAYSRRGRKMLNQH